MSFNQARLHQTLHDLSGGGLITLNFVRKAGDVYPSFMAEQNQGNHRIYRERVTQSVLFLNHNLQNAKVCLTTGKNDDDGLRIAATVVGRDDRNAVSLGRSGRCRGWFARPGRSA